MRGGEKRGFIKSENRGAVVLVLLILLFQIFIFSFSVFIEKNETIAMEITQIDCNSEKEVSYNEVYSQVKPDKLNKQSFPDSNQKLKKSSRSLFKFNPNTICKDSLVLLGLSEKQAQVYLNYRSKIKRFKSKDEIKQIYVISEQLFNSIESYIDDQSFVVELNSADSATLITLPGIGPYYAKKILDYRDRVGGFYCKEQLTEIYGIDSSRFNKFSNVVYADSLRIERKSINLLSKEDLERNPYLDRYTSSYIWSIICSKKITDLSLANFLESGIISRDIYKKLIYYFY